MPCGANISIQLDMGWDAVVLDVTMRWGLGKPQGFDHEVVD